MVSSVIGPGLAAAGNMRRPTSAKSRCGLFDTRTAQPGAAALARSSVHRTALAADGNQDGEIDAADYYVWRENFGQAAAGAAVKLVNLPVTWSARGVDRALDTGGSRGHASGSRFAGRGGEERCAHEAPRGVTDVSNELSHLPPPGVAK